MSTTPFGENENIVNGKSDEYYEELASQEEIYLEQIEENLRAIAICELDASRTMENLDDLRECAVENLVTGDLDDPPVSEQTIEELGRDL